MATEIERKFLVKRELWAKVRTPGVRYRQGYLALHPGPSVRVRVAGDEAFVTIKGPRAGIERPEFEYPIPREDAEEMLATLCIGALIEKTRHSITHDGREWVVDEFLGDNTGLIVAEIELPSADTAITLPDWIGEEVSDDPRYFNARLSAHPYNSWAAR